MRLLTFIASVLALISWACFLFVGIHYYDFAACALESEAWLIRELLHKVVLPTVMLSLSLISLVRTNMHKTASKVVLFVSLVNLASIPIYWVSFTGLIFEEPILSICESQLTFRFPLGRTSP